MTAKKHKQLKKDKFCHSASDMHSGKEDSKVWFTQQDRRTVSHHYLLALVDMCAKKVAPKIIEEVPYGVTDECYKVLLGLEMEKKRTRQKKLKFCHISDEVWQDVPKQKRKNTAKKSSASKKPKLHDSVGVAVDVLEGDEIPEECLSAPESSSSDSAGHCSPSAKKGDPTTGPTAPNMSEGPSSSTSSSSSSSSDSDQSSSSSSSSSSDSEAAKAKPSGSILTEAEPKPKAKPKPGGATAKPTAKGKAGGKKIKDRSFNWGDHLITPVGPPDKEPLNYQIRCGFAAHNVDHACTKKRAVTFGGKDTVLLCLKYWASLGSACVDCTEHFNLWDSTVVPAYKSGSLPLEEDLDNKAS